MNFFLYSILAQMVMKISHRGYIGNKCVMENIKRKNLSRILRTNVFFFGARVRAVILTHSTKDMMTILHARMLSGRLFTPLMSTLFTFQKFFSKTADVQIKFLFSPT